VNGSHLFEDVFVDAYFVTRSLTKAGVVAFRVHTLPRSFDFYAGARKAWRNSISATTEKSETGLAIAWPATSEKCS
jgi:hypothetical protein